MEISVKIDGIKHSLAVLHPRNVNRAMVRTLNTTARGANANAIKLIGKRYFVKARRIRQAVNIYKAHPTRLHADIVVSTKKRVARIPLIDYRVTKQKKGVKARVRRDRAGGLIKGAFIATMESGHKGVFIRRAVFHPEVAIRRPKRVRPEGSYYYTELPIDEMYGPSVEQMYGSRYILHQTRIYVYDRMHELFPKEIAYQIERAGLAA